MGRPTYSETGLRLDYIEKAPVTDIRLVEIMLVALTAYGTLLGANHLKIMHPVNAAVRDYYVSFGFSYISAQFFLAYHLASLFYYFQLVAMHFVRVPGFK